MWTSTLGLLPYPRLRPSKLITIYILVLIISIGFISCQRSPFKHQINNRNPEIDPFWYVGRGVRPIGRFGKRQLKCGQKSLRPVCSGLDLLLTDLQRKKATENDA